MGHYKNHNGTLSLISGKGRAEYGASTVRTGSITVGPVAIDNYEYYDVVFSSPMPDTDYIVELEGMRVYAVYNVDGRTDPAYKTVNGFRFYVMANGKALDEHVVKYTAYKLYTDTEYNNILAAMPSNASESNKLVTEWTKAYGGNLVTKTWEELGIPSTAKEIMLVSGTPYYNFSDVFTMEVLTEQSVYYVCHETGMSGGSPQQVVRFSFTTSSGITGIQVKQNGSDSTGLVYVYYR